MDGLHIRAATPDDQEELDVLYAAVFGEAAFAAFLRRRVWQYQRNPYASAPELLVAVDGARIVGQTGGLPFPLIVDGIERSASWGADTLVHPQWRRRGIAGQLVDAWTEHSGHAVTLGLGPAANQRDMLLGRGHRSYGDMVGYHLAQEGRAADGPAAVAVEPLAVGDERLDGLWARVGSAYRALGMRDRKWLDWRFHSSPWLTYALFGAVRNEQLVGYSVLRVTPRQNITTLLIDWLAHPEDHETLTALIVHARLWGGRQGATGIFTFASERRLVRHLEAAGFGRTDFTCELLSQQAAPSSIALPDLSEWHLSLGDSDKDRTP